MKTLLLLVDDDYADTLQGELPEGKAWVLPQRYDTFRCALHTALESARTKPDTLIELQSVITETNAWLDKASS